MRIAVVTCKVKPPSSDYTVELDNGPHEKRFARASAFSGRLPATRYSQDDFVRELTQLMNFHGKCKQVGLSCFHFRLLLCSILMVSYKDCDYKHK